MTNPTKKELVVQSLKSLHKERVKIKFRIKALRLRRKAINTEEETIQKNLQAIESKLLWEVNTHAKTLNDKT